jgi:hypothetical protein
MVLRAFPSLHSSGLNFVFLHIYGIPYGCLPQQLPSKTLATQTFTERSHMGPKWRSVVVSDIKAAFTKSKSKWPTMATPEADGVTRMPDLV